MRMSVAYRAIVLSYLAAATHCAPVSDLRPLRLREAPRQRAAQAVSHALKLHDR
jgi:hypothetical protein